MFPLRVETAAPTPVFNRTTSHAVPRTPCEPEFAIDPSAVSLICPVGEGSGGVVFKARYNGKTHSFVLKI